MAGPVITCTAGALGGGCLADGLSEPDRDSRPAVRHPSPRAACCRNGSFNVAWPISLPGFLEKSAYSGKFEWRSDPGNLLYSRAPGGGYLADGLSEPDRDSRPAVRYPPPGAALCPNGSFNVAWLTSLPGAEYCQCLSRPGIMRDARLHSGPPIVY
jgi:hypothetical protein